MCSHTGLKESRLSHWHPPLTINDDVDDEKTMKNHDDDDVVTLASTFNNWLKPMKNYDHGNNNNIHLQQISRW